MTPFGPDNRLEDDGGDVVRTLVMEELFQVWTAATDRTRIGMSDRTAVCVRVEHPDDSWEPGSAGQRRGSPVSVTAPAVAPWYER